MNDPTWQEREVAGWLVRTDGTEVRFLSPNKRQLYQLPAEVVSFAAGLAIKLSLVEAAPAVSTGAQQDAETAWFSMRDVDGG